MSLFKHYKSFKWPLLSLSSITNRCETQIFLFLFQQYKHKKSFCLWLVTGPHRFFNDAFMLLSSTQSKESKLKVCTALFIRPHDTHSYNCHMTDFCVAHLGTLISGLCFVLMNQVWRVWLLSLLQSLLYRRLHLSCGHRGNEQTSSSATSVQTFACITASDIFPTVLDGKHTAFSICLPYTGITTK